jgi:hypothetical protein
MENSHFDLFNDVNISEKQLYQKIWGKKHISSWFFIRNAIRSSLIHATQASSMWIQHCQRSKSKCKSRAESVFIARTSYSQMLAGPLLSTIILSASSIEAFVRHCFVSTLRTKSHHIGQKELDDKFLEFDNTYPVQRIRMIISEVKADKLPAQIETEINDLFGFRNEVMHSDPIYHTQDFAKLIKLKVDKKEKKTVEKGPSRFKYYPDLSAHNRPLSLCHSLLSTVTHDKLVDHIVGTSESAGIMEFLNEIDMTNVDKGLLWGDPTFTLNYGQASLIAREMNSINKELNKVTMKDQLLFLKNMKGNKGKGVCP